MVVDPIFALAQTRARFFQNLTHSEKGSRKRTSYKLKVYSQKNLINAKKVIEERLAHYEKTGNENKASIYRLKRDSNKNILEKLWNVFS